MYHMNPQYVSWRTVVQVVFELQEMNRGQKFTYEVGQYYIIQKVVLSEVSLLCALVFYLFEKPNPQWVFTGGFTATGQPSYFKKPRNALAYDGRVSTATRNWSGQWMEESWSWELGLESWSMEGDDVPPS